MVTWKIITFVWYLRKETDVSGFTSILVPGSGDSSTAPLRPFHRGLRTIGTPSAMPTATPAACEAILAAVAAP